ncbi:MAG: dihydroneopterin aldolase [Verrucomicrobiota bacterium]
MDTITIKDLSVSYCVGVPDEERAKPQRLLLTVEMVLDFSCAAATDDLTLTIDYHAVSLKLLRFGENRSWKLIEKLAADIAEMILAEFKPQSVSVGVKKFIIPETRYIKVSLVRSTRPERQRDEL